VNKLIGSYKKGLERVVHYMMGVFWHECALFSGSDLPADIIYIL